MQDAVLYWVLIIINIYILFLFQVVKYTVVMEVWLMYIYFLFF